MPISGIRTISPQNDNKEISTLTPIRQTLISYNCFSENPEESFIGFKKFVEDARKDVNEREPENVQEAMNGMISYITQMLEEEFSENNFPFHNIEHSLEVGSRALKIADTIARAGNYTLADENLFEIIIASLGHDIVQESTIQEFISKREALRDNPSSDIDINPTATIKRQTGINEELSKLEILTLLEQIKINGQSFSTYLNLSNIEHAILGTTPTFAFETINDPKTGEQHTGLNITQPHLQKLLKRGNIEDYIVPISVMLADLPANFGMSNETENLESGLSEFRELHQEVGTIVELIKKHGIKVINEKLEDADIDEIIKMADDWLSLEISITMIQGINMQKILEMIKNNNPDTGGEIAEALGALSSNYTENASFIEQRLDEFRKKMEENTTLSNSNKLLLALKALGYNFNDELEIT